MGTIAFCAAVIGITVGVVGRDDDRDDHGDCDVHGRGAGRDKERTRADRPAGERSCGSEWNNRGKSLVRMIDSRKCCGRAWRSNCCIGLDHSGRS